MKVASSILIIITILITTGLVTTGLPIPNKSHSMSSCWWLVGYRVDGNTVKLTYPFQVKDGCGRWYTSRDSGIIYKSFPTYALAEAFVGTALPLTYRGYEFRYIEFSPPSDCACL